MLDIQRVLNETEILAARLDDRGPGVGDAVRQLAKDYGLYKQQLSKVESLKAQRNSLSSLIGALAKINPASFDAVPADQQVKIRRLFGDSIATGFSLDSLKTRSKTIGDEIAAFEPALKTEEARIDDELMKIPNPPHHTVPKGTSEKDNFPVRIPRPPKQFDFTPLDHADLGVKLGIVDFVRGVKIAKTRFALLKGDGARLQMALIRFMLDVHQKHGYEQVWPPFMVNETAMRGTGQLPKFEADLFAIVPPLAEPGAPTPERLFMIPTAEVPVTNIYADEILDATELPIRFCAYTPCFRSEAGSYGKDTRGLIRQHQFEKVELVKFTRPEDSENEHEMLVADAERILQLLDLPYRVMLLCTADQGFAAAKCYDLEVWLPGQNAFREISSCSNFSDFQARRANITFRPSPKAKPEFLHTINGSGLAVGRTLLAVLENYQRADGTVEIPAVLHPYMEGQTAINPRGRSR